MIPKGVFLDKVDIWFEDESRIGQKGTLSRIWAQKGTRPRVVRQQQYLYQYIFGAVCPKLGIGAAIVAPNVNIETMQKILEEISLHVQKGRHAVVVLDQAGWHVSTRLIIPNNLSLLPLPPYAPELNPQENVWRVLKDKYLCNRVFKNSEHIIDATCEAWNEFIKSPKNISSLCSRPWAKI